MVVGVSRRRRAGRGRSAGLVRFAALVRACHPEPTLAVTLAAALLAVAVRRTGSGVGAVAGTVLASQLCVGWSNDWLDAGRDALVNRPDKPIAAGRIPRRTVGAAGLLAGLALVPLALLSGWPAAVAAGLGLASGLAYNWPLKSSPLSPLPYLVSFAALAAFVVLGKPASPPWWLLAAAALLGAGAHFVNVLPDLADDARTGVRGLPHRLGAGGSWLAGGVLLLAATLVLVLGPPGAPSRAGLAILVGTAVALPAGAVACWRGGSRYAFRTVMVIALSDVVLLMLDGMSI